MTYKTVGKTIKIFIKEKPQHQHYDEQPVPATTYYAAAATARKINCKKTMINDEKAKTT